MATQPALAKQTITTPHRVRTMLLSLTVTVAVFLILFSRIELQEVKRLIQGLSLPVAGGFVALSLCMHLLRTVRYRLLLRAAGCPTRPVPLFWITLVRGLCVDLLPARTGELVYLYLVRTRLGAEWGAAATSFALAFLYDLIALAPLLALGAWFLGAGSMLSPFWLVGGSLVLLLLGSCCLLLLPAALGLARKLLYAWGGDNRRWAARLCALAEETETCLRQTGRTGLAIPLLLLSLGVRGCKYAALYVLLAAMLLPQGFTLAQFPPPRVFVGLVAAEMAASLPASGIAGFGAYEGTWAFVFSLLGFPTELAISTGIAHHLITQVYGYALGLLAAVALFGFVRPVTPHTAAKTAPGANVNPDL